MPTKTRTKTVSAEFVRFREATKALLSVPKKEVEKQKAAYQKKRQRIRSKRKAA
jgi:hypothetical protein